tara:strand:- start:1485 stop:1868 length:384 start_codon:yes stop_codon:yes gene_type:complete
MNNSNTPKTNIGVSSQAQDFINSWMETSEYLANNDQVEIFRFAVSWAIHRELKITPDIENESYPTKWGWTTVNGNNLMEDLIAALRPEFAESPSHYIEYLAEAGFRDLKRLDKENSLSFSTLFNFED